MKNAVMSRSLTTHGDLRKLLECMTGVTGARRRGTSRSAGRRFCSEHESQHDAAARARSSTRSFARTITCRSTSSSLRVRKRNPKVGYATVYRTLKLLVDSGVAAAAAVRRRPDALRGRRRAPRSPDLREVRPHPRVRERRDRAPAGARWPRELGGFRVLRHKHELYCLCPKEQGVPGGNCPNERLHSIHR